MSLAQVYEATWKAAVTPDPENFPALFAELVFTPITFFFVTMGEVHHLAAQLVIPLVPACSAKTTWNPRLADKSPAF